MSLHPSKYQNPRERLAYLDGLKSGLEVAEELRERLHRVIEGWQSQTSAKVREEEDQLDEFAKGMSEGFARQGNPIPVTSSATGRVFVNGRPTTSGSAEIRKGVSIYGEGDSTALQGTVIMTPEAFTIADMNGAWILHAPLDALILQLVMMEPRLGRFLVVPMEEGIYCDVCGVTREGPCPLH